MFYRDTRGQNQALSVCLTRSHSSAHLLINTSPQCGTCGYTLTSLRVRAGLDRVDSHAVQVKERPTESKFGGLIGEKSDFRRRETIKTAFYEFLSKM